MGSRSLHVRLGVAAVVTSVVVAALGLGLPPDLRLGISSLALALAQLAAGGFLLVGARRWSGDVSLRRTWLWLGISAVSSSGIFMVWAAHGFTSGSLPPVPSVADVFYLVALVSAIVALGNLLPRSAAGGWPVRWVLDSLIVAVALFVVWWVTLLREAVQVHPGPILRTVLVVAYPLVDIVAITLGTIVALRIRPSLRGVVGCPIVGIVVLCVGDALFTHLSVSLAEPRVLLPITMALWAAGYLLAVPVLPGATSRLAVEDPRIVRSSSVVPNAAAGTALVVGLLTEPERVVVAAGVVLCVLLLARQTLTVRAEADISERLEETVRKRTQELHYLAFHDELTGLVKREVLADRVTDAFARPPGDRKPLSVLVVDLDGFKAINDTYGHCFGDRVLVLVAARLQAMVRASDTVARIGGDEFAVMLDDVDPAGSVTVAQRLLEQFREPFPIGSNPVVLNASVGVAVSPEGEQADLLAQADVAMYAAKNAGKGQYRLFDAKMHDAALARLRVGAELGVAINQGDIGPHYQPIVHLPTGNIVGFEALARWQNRSGTAVSPAEFIPVAEETGLILELGQAILEKSCAQLATWQQRFPRSQPLTMSVNISSRQLHHPGLVELFRQTIDDLDVAHGSVRLELTESGLIDIPEVISKLHDLRTAGFALSIDDFGTGYSSLSYLRRLPVDTVKLDRSLVTAVTADPDEVVLLRGIIELVHGLGLSTIAEGVEQPEQMILLRSLGCHYAQGYHFWPPLTADAADAVMTHQSALLP